MHTLERLGLCATHLTDGGFGALVSALCAGKAPRLVSLLANHNRIGDDGAAALGLAARSGKLGALCVLGLGSSLTGGGVRALIDAASSLPRLHELRLSDNSALDGADADALQAAVRDGSFHSLEDIDLTDWSALAPSLLGRLSETTQLPEKARALLLVRRIAHPRVPMSGAAPHAVDTILGDAESRLLRASSACR